MNCLWLLLLLTCFGGNGNMQGDCGCNNGCGREGDRDGRAGDCGCDRGRDRDDDCDRGRDRDCDCDRGRDGDGDRDRGRDRDRDRDCNCNRGPESRPFTPFADTCGCEEKPVS